MRKLLAIALYVLALFAVGVLVTGSPLGALAFVGFMALAAAVFWPLLNLCIWLWFGEGT